jgi:hypothetical protein
MLQDRHFRRAPLEGYQLRSRNQARCFLLHYLVRLMSLARTQLSFAETSGQFRDRWLAYRLICRHGVRGGHILYAGGRTAPTPAS